MKKSFIKLLLIILLVTVGLSTYNYLNNKKAEENVINKEIKKDIKEKKNEVNLTLVGDFLFEAPFYDAVNNGYDKNEYFSLVKDYFSNDDISIGNMEVVIGNNNMKVSGVGYNFCAPEWVGDLVSSLSLEVLSTSNNHAFDRNKEGIISTINYFKNTPIKTVGTRVSKDEDFTIYLEKNGIKFGITAFTYGTNQKPNSDERYLINYYKDENGNILKDEIKNIINKLKENSDFVIVLMHWGLEFRYEPNNEQRELANYLNSLGVDIIVGSHSHNISPIEMIGDEHKTLVYYSLGNFVSHDDDIARTPLKEEEFDNAYQVGLLSKLKIIKKNDNINIEDINTELMINYFDKNLNNFKLIPFKDYNDEFEKSHLRYNKGLTKNFIKNMYENVINEEYRSEY